MKHERRSDRERLWVVSTNRHYGLDEIWILAKCALESVARDLKQGQEMPYIKIKFTNCSGSWCGRAFWTEYHRVPGKGVMTYRRILCRVGSPLRFGKPIQATYPRFKDMPEYTVNGYREAIVHIIAHEAQHAMGASGRKSGEEECELVAWDALDWYRKHQAEVDAKIQRVYERDGAACVRHLLKQTPEAKNAKALADAEKKLAQWKRKRKLAETKVKHYERTIKKLQRRADHLAGAAGNKVVPLGAEGHADVPPGLPEVGAGHPESPTADCRDGVHRENHPALAASPPA